MGRHTDRWGPQNSSVGADEAASDNDGSFGPSTDSSQLRTHTSSDQVVHLRAYRTLLFQPERPIRATPAGRAESSQPSAPVKSRRSRAHNDPPSADDPTPRPPARWRATTPSRGRALARASEPESARPRQPERRCGAAIGDRPCSTCRLGRQRDVRRTPSRARTPTLPEARRGCRRPRPAAGGRRSETGSPHRCNASVQPSQHPVTTSLVHVVEHPVHAEIRREHQGLREGRPVGRRVGDDSDARFAVTPGRGPCVP